MPKRTVHLPEPVGLSSGTLSPDFGLTLSEKCAEAGDRIAALGIRWPADSVTGDRRDSGER